MQQNQTVKSRYNDDSHLALDAEIHNVYVSRIDKIHKITAAIISKKYSMANSLYMKQSKPTLFNSLHFKRFL